MSSKFSAAVDHLDSLLEQNFTVPRQVKLEVCGWEHFTGPEVTFNQTFDALRHRRWVGVVRSLPTWLNTVGQALSELVAVAATPAQSRARATLLAQNWLQCVPELLPEPHPIEVPGDQVEYVWDLTLDVCAYDANWVTPLRNVSKPPARVGGLPDPQREQIVALIMSWLKETPRLRPGKAMTEINRRYPGRGNSGLDCGLTTINKLFTEAKNRLKQQVR